MIRIPASHLHKRIALLLCVALGVFAYTAGVLAQWTDPTIDIPGVSGSGGVDTMPLTTGNVDQTKIGPLTVWKNVSALTNLNVTGSLCWNGTTGAACRNGWESANIGSYVRLQTEQLQIDDYGFINLRNPDVAISQFTLRGIAADPESGLTVRAGVVGIAARSSDGYSYGVAGSAGTADLADHYGVYATDGGNHDAFAARFNGNVAFVGLPGESDLVVGRMYDGGGNLLGGITTARGNSLSEVCLNGVCRSTWDAGADTEWAVNTASATLWPGLATRGLSIGNGNFTVTLDVGPTAKMAVGGDVTAHMVVVGTPSSSLPSLATCGDHQCSASETIISCPDDCDTTPPDMVWEVTSQGPYSDGTINLTWNNPYSDDFGGTRILITDGIRPSSPNDGVPIDVIGLPSVLSPLTIRTSTGNGLGPFGHGKVYLWLYAYDVSRQGAPLNFSEPVIFAIDL